MLGAEQHISGSHLADESGIARIPRGPFEAGPGIDRHPQDPQRYSQLAADLLAVSRPSIGRGLQAVVDVDGGEGRQGFAPSEASQQMEQDGGVEPAGESDMPGRRMAPGGQGG
ncbi:hypothetical protein D3C84_810110 [compost metagenome]